MSFASGIKSELLRIENKHDCCAAAELCGIMSYGVTIAMKDKDAFRITTENAASARRCFALLKRLFGISGLILSSKGHGGKGKNSYSIVLSDKDETILKTLGFKKTGNKITFSVNEKIEKNGCCRRAFIRGAFLGGGSATNPEKEYHLEVATHEKKLSEDFTRLLEYYGIEAKTVIRKSSYVTYFKSSDEISDVLSVIGAHNSLMELMNIKILKETRNNVNRVVNCENANMDKTLDAAFIQIDAINRLKKTGRFERLPEGLKELSKLRLLYPDASLGELGSMMRITKSGVNHRFRKIVEIARENG